MLERAADEIYIVIPVIPTRLGWLTNDDTDANVETKQHLDDALAEAVQALRAARPRGSRASRVGGERTR